MLIAGIIFLVIGIICCVLAVIYVDVAGEFLGFLNGFFLVSGIVILINEADIEPTKKDVLSGKAIYQETIHITGNDTIKTYEIVWKEK